MSAEIIALRNEVSGVAYEYPKDRADKILAHPVWGKINKIVRTDKPEVLNPRQVDNIEDFGLNIPEVDASDEPATSTSKKAK